MDLNVNHKTDAEKPEGEQDLGRREAVRKLGKFAAYAAPFTLLAMTPKKAAAASFKTPGPKH